MKHKTQMILYGITMIISFVNAYFAYKHGNIDATIAWIVAAGFSGGASGAYMELHDKTKEEDDE